MSNRAFNDKVVPVLRPDPDHPGATVDKSATNAGAVEPRKEAPETGFALRKTDDLRSAGSY